ncbi:hypothetical protein [Chitinophaga arvensicola]|uniref:Uncharacterized protein n=1 Tax=Chitinophaga arvensicola TaxID=29529 RepID=A0A1I0S7I4_9BACT|nr:hypothetical protein [Chitinophaga arvensicola]SEW51603.1 hypothetical protein SAMN04488122_4363 [Chitinophaga arvensicola]
MRYKIFIYIMFILILPVILIAQNVKLGHTDSLFIEWNKATIQSIENQIKVATDKSVEALYLNEDSAFRGYIEIENITTINRRSVRYLFLSAFNSYYHNCGDEIYVVEANESGERVRICNYVLSLNTATNSVDIVRFLLIGEKWIKDLGTNVKIDNLATKWRKFETQRVADTTQGVNDDVVIVTMIKNGVIRYSNYYPEGRLTNDNLIESTLLAPVRNRVLF